MTPVSYFSAIQIAAVVLAIVGILATTVFLLLSRVKQDPRLKNDPAGETVAGLAFLESLEPCNEPAKSLNSVLKGRLDQSLIDILGDEVDRHLFFDVLEHIGTSQDSGVD